MYSVEAQVLNSFYVAATEKYDESWKVQLLGENVLKGGQIKKEMLTLTVPEVIFNSLKGEEGEMVTLPIGFFVNNNNLVPFYPKNIQTKSIPENG